MERLYIGLGSNLAEPRQQLHSALQAIAALPHSQLLGVSSFYLSDPLGPADQPRYLNAVAELDCALEPLQLLDALQAIELDQGRGGHHPSLYRAHRIRNRRPPHWRTQHFAGVHRRF